MKKQAKFFCENCGEEVAQNARFCKKCGRFFSAVRCPQCGKVGSSHSFVNGCPACGYAEKGKNGKSSGSSSGSDSYSSSNSGYSGQKKDHFYFHKNHSSTGGRSGSLPVWIYIATFIGLVVMIVLLMRCTY